jgi:hypothetical protein
MNLPTTFDPIAYTGEVEKAAREAGWTVRYLSPMESGPRPWFQRAAPDGDSTPPRLYLSAGIHGDEISGPLALLEMIRQPAFFADFGVSPATTALSGLRPPSRECRRADDRVPRCRRCASRSSTLS